ncbi:MAG: T9SS type A sorting domain-containing protein [Saprospiraceae bacterium]
MTPTQQGRHCSACAKTVVDFTKMSDAQVLAHLKKASDETCGRIRNDQLGRPLIAPIIEGLPRWVSVGLASIAAVAGSTAMSAQQIQGEIAPIRIDTSILKQPVDTVDLQEVVVKAYKVDPMEVDPTAIGQYGKRQRQHVVKAPNPLAFQRFNYSGIVRLTNGQPASFSEVRFLTPSGKIAHTIQTQNDGAFASFFSNEIESVQVFYQGKITTQKISPVPDEEIIIILTEDVAEVVGYRVDAMELDETTQGLMVIQRRTPKSFVRKMERKTYQALANLGRFGHGVIDKLKSPAGKQQNQNTQELAFTIPAPSGDSAPSTKSNQIFTLYPNPSTGYGTVKFNGETEATLLNVLNAAGQLVLSKAVDSAALEVQINLPSGAARGVYTIQLANANGETIASSQWIVN